MEDPQIGHTYTISLTNEQLNIIGEALSKRPFGVVNETWRSIESQVDLQNQCESVTDDGRETV